MSRSHGLRDGASRALRSPLLWVGCAVVLLAMSIWPIPLWLTRTPLTTARLEGMAQIRTELVSAFVALGAVGGLAYTARTFRESQSSNLIGRFQVATQHLGDDNPTIRMVGLHAMEQLADVWRDQRQVCIDALCAYVRGDRAARGPGDEAADVAMQQVRRTAIEIIAAHLRGGDRASWRGHRFDLRGAVLDVGDLSRIHLTEGELLLDGTRFVGPVSFDHAVIAGGTLSLAGAEFQADASFAGLMARSGRLSLEGARIGAELRFEGADLRAGGQVVFDRAQVLAAGGLTFGGATVAATRPEGSAGPPSPRATRLHGSGVSFVGLELHDGAGPVGFDGATLTGHLRFDGVVVCRPVSFRGVSSRDTHLGFQGASFASGEVAFDGADLAGATIDLTDATTGGGWLGLERIVGAAPDVTGQPTFARLPPAPGPGPGDPAPVERTHRPG